MPSTEVARLLSQFTASSASDLLIDAVRVRLGRMIEARVQGTDVDIFNDSVESPSRLSRPPIDARLTGTASSFIVPPTPVSETTIEALIATQDAYGVRRAMGEKHVEAVGDHQSRYLDEWQQRVKNLSQKPASELLESLWDSGFSWRDIARLLQVSVPAVQKWRAGENMSPKNFSHLRDFIAAYDTVAANKPEVDVAGWLDVPLVSDIPITLQQLWTEGSPPLFFEYALGDLKPEAALDQFDSEWRQRYRDDGFETFVGADGHLSISTKNR